MALRKNVAKRCTLTLANAATTTSAIHIKSGQLAGIATGASVNGLASLTMTVSDAEDGTYVTHAAKDGTATSFTLTGNTSKMLGLSPLEAQTIPEWVKFVANTGSTGTFTFDVYVAD
jgi:hypothetical protein